MPEVAPELRQDVRDALAASGGAYTTPALQGMKKLDSFLKEVLRCSPTTLGTFVLYASAPCTLYAPLFTFLLSLSPSFRTHAPVGFP